jgi:hypothetical protein
MFMADIVNQLKNYLPCYPDPPSKSFWMLYSQATTNQSQHMSLVCKHCFKSRLTQIPVFVNEVLLDSSPTYHRWLLWHYNSRVEQMRQRLCGTQSLKYLLHSPL